MYMYVKLRVEVGHNCGRKCCKMYIKEIQVKDLLKKLLFYLEFKIKSLYIMT